jgi:uncharacterized protein YdaU (DUF1376 family)
MATFPALPLWCDAFAMDCGHLSLAEEGLYFRLLRTMWTSPECRVPNDDTWLRRRLRVTAEELETIVRPIIKEFCQSSGNWITQKRLLKEHNFVTGKSRKQSAKAKKRWSSADAGAMPEHAGAMPGSIHDGGKFESEGGTVSDNPLENNNSDVCRGNAPTPTPTPTPTKKEEKNTSYSSLGATDGKSGDLFGTEKQAPPSAAERGSPTTEFTDRPTSPPEASPRGMSRKDEEEAASGSQTTNASPSLSSAVPQRKAEPGGISESKKVPPHAARTDFDATVAPPSNTAADCGVPKRRRSKDKPLPDTPESEEFWRAYPRHDGKYDFRIAFASALTKATAPELIAAAERYAASRVGEDPKWTLYASTWLNKERWTDEPAAARVIDMDGNPVPMPPRANGPRRSKQDETADRWAEKFVNRQNRRSPP